MRTILIGTLLVLGACMNDRTLPAPGDGFDYGTCEGQQGGYVQRWGNPAGKRQVADSVVLWAYYLPHDHDFHVLFDGHLAMECDITVSGHTP